MTNVEYMSKDECVKDVRQACYHFANLYYHFAKVIIDELGKEKGRELIKRAVKNFAVERGLKVRKKAIEMGLQLSPQNLRKVTDIPLIAWDSPEGFYCPYGDVWKQKGDIGREVGFIYCEVNDTTLFETYCPEWKQIKFTKHVLWGDGHCDRVTEYRGKKLEE